GTTLSGVRIHAAVTDPDDAWTTPVTEPATGQVLSELIGGRESEARRAVDVAASMLPAWSEQTANYRASVLRAIASELRTEAIVDEISTLITQETGKRLAEARAEVGLSAAYFDWFADVLRTQHDASWSLVPGVWHEVT